MSIKTFNRIETAKIVNKSGRTVQWMVMEKIIIPYENPSGTGTKRRYSLVNIFDMLLGLKLNDYLSWKQIKELLKELHETDRKGENEFVLESVYRQRPYMWVGKDDKGVFKAWGTYGRDQVLPIAPEPGENFFLINLTNILNLLRRC